MAVYYNEIDAYAAEWLRNLMKKGLIPDGEVDTRSIIDVRPSDLRGFKQCHYFAGVAGWSHALRLAGWADDREIWTGSCPCQPFSVAGKGKGTADERHLWPVFFDLIRECRPPVVMGEQVAGKAGYGWLDGVRADLEGEGYACRGVDIPACAVDAPHIRQRLYWVAVGNPDAVRELQSQGVECLKRGWVGDTSCGDMADADSRDPRAGRGDDGEMRSVPAAERGAEDGAAVFGRGGEGYGHGDLVDAHSAGQREHRRPVAVQTEQPSAERAGGDAYDMADATNGGCQFIQNAGPAILQPEVAGSPECGQQPRDYHASALRNGSFWSDAEWRFGADGKSRRAQPGLRLLVDGVPGRVGLLRIGGNAIVPQVAAEVISALMETL